MNRIKILFCIDNLVPDGAQRQLVDLVKHIDQSRYDISVCGIRGGLLRKEIEILGIPVHVVGKRTWWEIPRVVFKLYKFVKEKKPLIIQSSLFQTNFLTGLIGRLLGIPIIISVQHSVYEQDLSGWMKPLASLTRKLSHATVTVFETGQESVSDRNRVVSIPNGVDLERFHAVVDKDVLLGEFGANSEDTVVLTAGRLSPEKGQKYLIKAAAILAKTSPQMKCFIAGEGRLRHELEQLAEDLGISSNVTFLGRRNDMPQLYQMCDVFVLPSFHEGFGLVAAEAMASRMPVVATEAVSVNKLIIDNETGFLVPAQDPEAIAEKVTWIIQNPDAGKKVAVAGFKRVKSLFSSPLMAGRYMELYQRLLSERTC